MEPQPDFVVEEDQPWWSNTDQIFRVWPPDDHLRLLYIFANPDNGTGYRTVEELVTNLQGCLQTLADMDVSSIAMIHLPLAARQQGDPRPHDDASAVAMITALRDWDQSNAGRIDDVYLVDLQNSFAARIDP